MTFLTRSNKYCEKNPLYNEDFPITRYRHCKPVSYNSNYGRSEYRVASLLFSVSVAASTTPMYDIDVSQGPSTKKLDFLVSLYFLQNWDGLNTACTNKVQFGKMILLLYEALRTDGIITGPGADIPPLFIQKEATLETLNRLRPGSTLIKTKEVISGRYPTVNLHQNLDDSPLVLAAHPPPQDDEKHGLNQPSSIAIALKKAFDFFCLQPNVSVKSTEDTFMSPLGYFFAVSARLQLVSSERKTLKVISNDVILDRTNEMQIQQYTMKDE
ncbi:uncharacterized protein EV154DRAFT_487064 [Mucor mucedo]|uniref:uncharacterized protein n=1 Tax=Mucor mucedo TaxID=29922 RepID=UPI002220D73B|nr:uncharacterized protein EV154DRAFT_487064 [Mucor mucedo]KAI7873744.1 hypothetical protein EV154DRAFT_487064 [Mucor mucedo]